MSLGRRLRQVGLASGLFAFTALACGADTISLLPPLTGGTAGMAASAGSRSVSDGGDDDNDGHGGSESPGDAGRGGGGAAGTSPNGGVPSFGGVFCNGCGGLGNASGSLAFGGNTCVPGYDNCTPCGPNGQCPMDQQCAPELGNVCVWCQDRDDYCGKDARCDVLTGRCAPACANGELCFDGKICDKAQGVCLQCASDHDCDRIRPDMICHQHRCVECEVSDDCTGRGRRYCVGYRCYECIENHECPEGKSCDGGRCE